MLLEFASFFVSFDLCLEHFFLFGKFISINRCSENSEASM
jgi:hypothetical protein